MSNEITTSADAESVATSSDDLATFKSEFFGQDSVEDIVETATEDPVEDFEDAPIDNEDTPEEDALESEDHSETEEDNSKGKKKNRFQERINELTGKAKEAARREKEALDRIKALEDKLNQTEVTKPQAKIEEAGEPSADDKNEDGTDKYPLGEFDPNFIRDLTKYAYSQERARTEEQARVKAEEDRIQREQDAASAELRKDWQQKLGPAQERYPDFQEKGEELLEGFSDLDQSYGEYLTATLMSMEFGPDVLYYLASNPDEAHRIVNMGPQKASIALGRIEAGFANEVSSKIKVSKAPSPPPTNKGMSASVGKVRADTDDLAAFKKDFFKSK